MLAPLWEHYLQMANVKHDFKNGEKRHFYFSAQSASNANQGCQMVHLSTKKSQFGNIFEGLGMENVGILYVYF
jgi:hypothetical protein